MRSLKTVTMLTGLVVLVALYWLLGSGALGTGDLQLEAPGPGPAGGGRSSPSAAAAGSPKTGAPAGGQDALAGAPNTSQRNTSPGSNVGAAQAVPTPSQPPLVLVSPANIIPENVVTASGQGFQPAEEVDLLTQASGAAVARGNALADKDGNFYGVPITITADTGVGDYTVRARGRTSGRQADTSLHVSGGAPFAEPSTYSGKGMTPVNFEGGGFLPAETVSVHFDSLAVDPLQQVIAGPYGGVVLTATVPLADPGEHAFILVGAQSNNPLRIPFSVVAFNPWLSLDNYSPRPQQPVGFSGHDFAPGETVQLFRQRVDGNPIATAQVGANGEFNLPAAYELPYDAVGKNLFVALGQHSRTVVSATVDVLPFDPSIELSVYAGQPGTTVAFKGTGYARGERITAYLGGAKDGHEAARFQAGDDGNFEAVGAFQIPPNTSEGPLTIATVGELSRKPLELTFAVLPLTPWAGLSQYAGPPGTTFTFAGNGFLPGESVTIHLGDRQAPTLGSVQADQNGTFQGGGKYTVPETADGKINFTMLGETSQAVTTITFTVTDGPTDVGDGTPVADQTATATPVPTAAGGGQ